MTGFVRACSSEHGNAKVPSAFIITGANVATQGLLFDQLADTLRDRVDARVVTLRSADASNLKAALRKIIRHATARLGHVGAAADDDKDVAVAHDVCPPPFPPFLASPRPSADLASLSRAAGTLTTTWKLCTVTSRPPRDIVMLLLPSRTVKLLTRACWQI